jgi:hypothetical protein
MGVPRREIRSLRPNVTETEAVQAFESPVARAWRSALGGTLRSVAPAFVPFRLYEVEVFNRGAGHTTCFGADAVNGTLDLYEFDQVPAAAELVTIDTVNSAPPRVDEARSLELLEAKVRRAIFQTGFFRVRGLRVHATRLPVDIHVPYWLGFFGNGERARLRVMDAVRRRMEGAKARALFEDWLGGRVANAPPP